MQNQNKIEAELYSDLTHCLQLFNKKNKLMAKIIKWNHLDSVHQLQNMEEIAKFYTYKYSKKDELFQSHNLIIKRFITRIKQNSKTFLISYGQHQKVSQYIHSILLTIPDENQSIKLSTILKNILLKKQAQLKDDEKTIESAEINSMKSSSEYLLSSFEKEQIFMKGMFIDHAEFRKSYFLAKEEQTRKNNILLNNMMKRNGCIHQTLQVYMKNFQHFKNKITRSIKIKNKSQNKQRQGSSLSINNKKQVKNKLKFKTKENKRFITIDPSVSQPSSPLKRAQTFSNKSHKIVSLNFKKGQKINQSDLENFVVKIQKESLYKMAKINLFVMNPQITAKSTVEKVKEQKKKQEKNEESSFKRYAYLSKTIEKKSSQYKKNEFNCFKLTVNKRY